MDAEDARATGAMRDDVNGMDLVPDHLPPDLDSVASPEPETPNTHASLRVPGGTTDPMWYLIAEHLAPKHTNRTDRLRWIEGFVAAMEAARGEDVEDGLAEVLRSTLRDETLVTNNTKS